MQPDEDILAATEAANYRQALAGYRPPVDVPDQEPVDTPPDEDAADKSDQAGGDQ